MTLTGESPELTGVAAGDGEEASRSKVALTGVAGRATAAAAAAGVAGVGEESVQTVRFRAPRDDSFDGETPRVTAGIVGLLGLARGGSDGGYRRRPERNFWAAWRRGGDSSHVWVAGRAIARDYIGQGPLVPAGGLSRDQRPKKLAPTLQFYLTLDPTFSNIQTFKFV